MMDSPADRLRKWANPLSTGNPAKRMQQMWPRGPMDMAKDINAVLRLLDEAKGDQ